MSLLFSFSSLCLFLFIFVFVYFAVSFLFRFLFLFIISVSLLLYLFVCLFVCQLFCCFFVFFVFPCLLSVSCPCSFSFSFACFYFTYSSLSYFLIRFFSPVFIFLFCIFRSLSCFFVSLYFVSVPWVLLCLSFFLFFLFHFIFILRFFLLFLFLVSIIFLYLFLSLSLSLSLALPLCLPCFQRRGGFKVANPNQNFPVLRTASTFLPEGHIKEGCWFHSLEAIDVCQHPATTAFSTALGVLMSDKAVVGRPWQRAPKDRSYLLQFGSEVDVQQSQQSTPVLAGEPEHFVPSCCTWATPCASEDG